MLNYVPADAEFVLATQRVDGINLEVYKQIVKRKFRYDEDDKLYTQVLEPLVLNYSKNASEWGLDPEGNIDFASYIYDGKVWVAHITVADEHKALGKLHESFIKIVDDLIDEDTPSIEYEHLDNHGIHGQWDVYHVISKNEYFEFDVNVGVHAYDGVLTFALYDSKADIPEYVLSASENAFSVKKYDSSAFLVGHADYARVLSDILKWKTFSREMNEEYIRRYVTAEDNERFKKLCAEKLEYCDYLRMTDVLVDKLYGGDYDQYYSDRYGDDDYDDDEQVGYCLDDMTHEADIIEAEKKKAAAKLEATKRREKLKEIWDAAEHIEKGADVLHLVGSTSWDDDVCISEIKEWLSDMPELDGSISGTPSGLFGMRFTQSVSNELMADLRDLATDYVELGDGHELISIAMGMSIDKIKSLIVNRLNKKKFSEWKCQQLRGYLEDMQNELDRSSAKDEFEMITSIMSGSGRIDCLDSMTSGSEQCDRDVDYFLATMRFKDAAKMKDFANEVFDDVPDGEIHEQRSRHGLGETRTIGNGQDFLIGSEKFDLSKIDLNKRSREHLLDIYIHKVAVKLLMDIFYRRAFEEDYEFNSMRARLDLGDQTVNLTILPAE